MDDRELDSRLGIQDARQRAEEQLLSLLRGEIPGGFNLTISESDGQWTVSLDDLDHGLKSTGAGKCFAEAWHLIGPSSL